MTDIDLKMAEKYRLYLLSLAYIPYQDLTKYEKAYKKVSK